MPYPQQKIRVKIMARGVRRNASSAGHRAAKEGTGLKRADFCPYICAPEFIAALVVEGALSGDCSTRSGGICLRSRYPTSASAPPKKNGTRHAQATCAFDSANAAA